MAQTFFQTSNTLALLAWIARDSVKLGLPWLLRTVALVLTFLSGPVGLLMYIVGRWFLRREVAVD
jgi:hypothetical protein